MRKVNLYLDDIRSAPDDSWTVVRTAEEARDMLASGRVEYASLDHDLGVCPKCNVVEDTDEGPRVVDSYPCPHMVTGYDLVRWMAETGTWPAHKPMVHSANPVGRANMIATIERYWQPPAPQGQDAGSG